MRGVRKRIAGHLVLVWVAVLWAGFTAGPLVPRTSASTAFASGADEHAAHGGHQSPTPAPEAPCDCTGHGCCPPAILAPARSRWEPLPTLVRWHDPVTPGQQPREARGRFLPYPLGPPTTPIS